MENMARRTTVHISSAKAEIERLATVGVEISLITIDAQPYAHVGNIEAPSPPWDRTSYEILVAIPIAYDLGTGLDGFYVALPYSYEKGEHNRVNGKIVNFDSRQWKGVSWHYPDGKQFRIGIDNVESHIVHCRGFFLARGAVNAKD